MAVCSKAWIDGVTGKPYYWVRTPRSGEGRAATQAVAKAPGQVGRGAP
jgi:hypothetical protein